MRSAAELSNKRREAIHGRRARAQRSGRTGAGDLSGAPQGGAGEDGVLLVDREFAIARQR